MLENDEKRTFKLETARAGNLQPRPARPRPRKDQQARLVQTREIVVKLIEAIRKM